MVEVLAVIVVLGIFTGIAVFSVLGMIEKSRKDVCDVNVVELERLYETYLVLKNLEHSDVIFGHYLMGYGEEICPEKGDIRYLDGSVHCSLHSNDRENLDSDEENEGGVPFL